MFSEDASLLRYGAPRSLVGVDRRDNLRPHTDVPCFHPPWPRVQIIKLDQMFRRPDLHGATAALKMTSRKEEGAESSEKLYVRELK